MNAPALLVAALCSALAVVGPGRAAAQVPAGETVFQQKCSSCHSIGGGVLVGPDLLSITARRDRDWLVRWIASPDRMLAAGDSIAVGLQREFNGVPMPNMALSGADVAAVLAYIESRSAAQPAASAVGAPAPPLGDARAGQALFTGAQRFANGGPACMACHGVAGLGALGGGALGPDLTLTFAKYGEAGLAAILADPPFPTMSPIFRRRPLTPPERSDVEAFLRQAAAGTRPIGAVGALALLAAGGALVLLGLAQATWRHRLLDVRRPMVRRATPRESERIPAGREA